MGTTPTYSWPYPEPTDPVANGAQDIEDLALAVETTVSGITGGKILQVVSTLKTDTFSTTSATYVDVTGLSASITPTSATSNVLAIFTVSGMSTDASGAEDNGFIVLRGATEIATADSGGDSSWTGQLSQRLLGTNPITENSAVTVLDSPATTSATTYKVQVKVGGGTLYVNRSPVNDVRSVSSVTLMEVSA